MQLEMKEIEELAEKLNLSKEEMLRESLKFFLERKLREIKTEIFTIGTKYGVSSVEELEEKYKKGEIEEKDTWQDLHKLDHLEFKKDELEKALRAL
jgi:Ribbon-helix-helix protein, copG family.